MALEKLINPSKSLAPASAELPGPEFGRDNPGGEWLKNKKELSDKAGLGTYGARRSFGAVTGSFREPVHISVDKLRKVKGISGEHLPGRTRPDSLEYLKEHMKHGRLPELHPGREYHPFVTVDQDGTPWMNEGNHRVKAAHETGWKHMPVEVRYFNGGEDVKGDWHPSKLKEDHHKLVNTPRIPKHHGS